MANTSVTESLGGEFDASERVTVVQLPFETRVQASGGRLEAVSSSNEEHFEGAEYDDNGTLRSLLAVSSRFGFAVFASAAASGFALVRTAHLSALRSNAARDSKRVALTGAFAVATPAKVAQIKLSASNELVLVALVNGAIHVHQAKDLLNNKEKPFRVYTCPAADNDPVLLAPNPETFPDILAVIASSDESLHLLNLATGEFTHLDKLEDVSCMCWSRKGKQLAVGDKGEGLVRQVSLEGVVKNTIAKPPCFAEIDVEVHSLVWLEDKVFVVIYHMTETEENVPFVITQSGTAKTGISTSYVRLEDPIFHEDDRTCNYLPVVLRDLGETKYLLAYASTSSNEIGFLGTRDDSSTAWARVSLADNVILPLDEADNDTHALGFDVDYTSRVTVPSKNPDMTPDLPPAPLLYVLTTEGSLLVYTLCDMRLAGRERSCPAMVAEVSSPTRALSPRRETSPSKEKRLGIAPKKVDGTAPLKHAALPPKSSSPKREASPDKKSFAETKREASPAKKTTEAKLEPSLERKSPEPKREPSPERKIAEPKREPSPERKIAEPKRAASPGKKAAGPALVSSFESRSVRDPSPGKKPAARELSPRKRVDATTGSPAMGAPALVKKSAPTGPEVVLASATRDASPTKLGGGTTLSSTSSASVPPTVVEAAPTVEANKVDSVSKAASVAHAKPEAAPWPPTHAPTPPVDAAPWPPTDMPKVPKKQPPATVDERDGGNYFTETLTLKQIPNGAKTQVSEEFESPQPDDEAFYNLLAVSNKFGYVVFGTHNGFGLAFTQDVQKTVLQSAAKEQFVKVTAKHDIEIHDEDIVNQIRLSASQEVIYIGTVMGSIMLYKAADIANGVYDPFKTLNCPDESNMVLQPNPEAFPDHCAVLSGEFNLFMLNTESGEFTPLSDIEDVSAMCWSRKGKQLAVGDHRGVVRQLSVEGTVKNTIARPPQYADVVDVGVESIVWLEDKTFAVIYSVVSAEEPDAPPEPIAFVVTQTGTAKTGMHTTYLKLQDPCGFHVDDRLNNYYWGLMSGFGEADHLLVYSCFNSPEIGLIGLKDGEWATWNLVETLNLPVDEHGDDMFPLGMEIDFTNSDRVKSDPKTNSPELCPVPLVYILSSDGNLLVYNCVDTVLVGKDRACEAMKPAEKLPGLKPTAVSASFVNPPGSKLPGNVTTGLKVDAQSEKPAFQWGFAPDPSAPATKPSPPPPTSMFSNIALKSNIPVSSFGNGAPVDPFTIVNSPSEAATKPVFGGLFSTALSSTSLPSTVAFTNPPAVTGPSFPLFGNPASSEGSKPAIPSQMSFSNPSASQPVASAPPLFGVKAAEVGTKPATIVAKPADTTAAKPSFGVPSFGFSNSPGTEAKSAFGTELGNGPRPLLSKPNPLVKGDASSASSSPFGAGKSVFDSVAASPSPVPSLKPVPSVSAPPAPSPPKVAAPPQISPAAAKPPLAKDDAPKVPTIQAATRQPAPLVAVQTPQKRELLQKAYATANNHSQLFDRFCAEIEDELKELKNDVVVSKDFFQKSVANVCEILQRTQGKITNLKGKVTEAEAPLDKVAGIQKDLKTSLLLVKGKYQHSEKLLQFIKKETKSLFEEMNVLGPEFAHLQDVLTRKTKKLEGSLSEIKGALLEIKGLLEMKANAGSAQAVKLPDWETICRNVRRITSHTVTLSRQLDTLLQVLQDEKQSQLTAAKVVPTPTKSKNSFNAIFESDDDNLRPKDAVRLPDALKQQQQLTLALQLLLKSDKAPKIKVITSKQAAALPQSQSPHWTCPKCLIPNDEASAVCSACDTAREGESESRPSVFGSTASNTAGFGMGTNTATSTLMTKSTTATVFKVQAAVADWTCDVCIIKNPGNKVKCMACEAAKPSVTNEMSATAKTASAGTTSVSFAPETTKSAVSGAVGGFSFASVKSETASSGGFSFSSVKSAASTAGGFSFKPAASDENAIFRPAATTTAGDQWTCNVCMINNPSEKTKCMACEANKPGSKPEAALPAAAPASSGGFSFGAPKAVPATPLTGGFSFTPAKPDAPSGSGFTFAPAKSDAPASGGFSFNGSTSKPADAPKPATASLLPDWTCDVCMINNPSVKEKCMACEADKPGKRPAAALPAAAPASSGGFSFGAPKAVPATPLTGGFSFTPAKPDAPSGSGFTFAPAKSDAPASGGFSFNGSTSKPADAPKPATASLLPDWTCDVCMINNPSVKEKCMACEADKPGKKPAAASTPAASASGFSFGGPKTIEPAAPVTGDFSFTPAKPDAPSGSGFTFAPAKSDAPPAGGFTFETVKSDAATPGGFSFGAPALKSTEKLPMEAPKPVISSSASTWTCDVCMINNPGDKMKCMACEADKPGDQPLEEATKTAHATTPSIAATGFSFPAAKTPAAASTGFSFSTPTSSTPSSPPKATTGSFSFAPATLNAKKEPKAAAPKDASGFSFGKPDGPVLTSTPVNVPAAAGDGGITGFGDSLGFDTKPKNKINPLFGAVVSSQPIVGEADSKPAFGSGSVFGSGRGVPSSTSFGQTTSTPSAFGGSNTTSAFGTPTGQSAVGTTEPSPFGQPAATSTPSAFGQTTSHARTSTSAFGQQSAFGQSAFGQSPQTSAFGASAASTSVFGSSSAFGGQSTPGAASQSPFGSSSANPPAFGVAASAASSSPFGQPAFGQSSFGQPQTSALGQQAAPRAAAFGQSAFGQSGFGASGAPAFPNVNTNNSSVFGQSTGSAPGFANVANTKSVFGSGAAPVQGFGASSGVSAFGGGANQQSQGYGNAGGFGGSSGQTSVFGSQSQTANQNTAFTQYR